MPRCSCPNWIGDLTRRAPARPAVHRELVARRGVIFNAADVLTIIVVPICFIALGLFMQRSTFGTAIRAAAERGDRAAMLGIPVQAAPHRSCG